MVSAVVCFDAQYLPVCLSGFGDSELPCDLPSLMDLAIVVDILFVQLFVSCKEAVATSKLLHARSVGRISTNCFISLNSLHAGRLRYCYCNYHTHQGTAA